MIPQYDARVLDISSTGIALLVRRHFPTGTVLIVEIEGGDEVVDGMIYAKVVRVLSHNETEWLTGCVFSRRLSDEETLAVHS